jgi:uncharacterized protein (DUF1330 family)
MSHAFMPDDATLARLRNASLDGPVVMLNLLRYREPGGREAFARYGAITGPLIERSQGRLLYGGTAGPELAGPGPDPGWHDVLLVRFPSARHFLDMIESETYQQQAAPIRAEALEATVWLTTHPMPGFDS